MKAFASLSLVMFVVALVLTGSPVKSQVNQQEGKKVTDEQRQRIIEKFNRTGLNTTPGDAMFLRVMADAIKAKRGVEVGSATGYGAINMGLAFERNGGKLFTLEIDPGMAAATRENIEAMGLEKTVEVVEGDALKTLPQLEGEFDFVFIDAHKPDYLKYLKAIEPKLKPGALVIADNTIQSARQMRDFLEYVNKSGVYQTALIRASIEKNDGMTVSVKLK